MRIGWIQTEPVYGDPADNLRRIEGIIEAGGADLWVLPELFSTGYLFGDRKELERLAEPVPDGPVTRGLLRLAARSGTAIIAGLAERSRDGHLYNSAVAVDRSGVKACYRKIHLFDYEKEWFDPGDGPFVVVELAGARVGLMICWDWRFPEAARTLALAGAQVIAHPSNLVLPFCQAAMVTRAMENRVFTATVNRIGTEERAGLRLTFTGGSRIVAPDGSVLSDGPAERAASGIVTIDLTLADVKRVTSHNDLLADRRPEFYRLG
jgi:5-aminopentanamidase